MMDSTAKAFFIDNTMLKIFREVWNMNRKSEEYKESLHKHNERTKDNTSSCRSLIETTVQALKNQNFEEELIDYYEQVFWLFFYAKACDEHLDLEQKSREWANEFAHDFIYWAIRKK